MSGRNTITVLVEGYVGDWRPYTISSEGLSGGTVVWGHMALSTVETACEIINQLVELDGARVAELSKRMDKPTSTIHDHLTTLQTSGYVVKEDQSYRASSRFLYIGERVLNQREIYRAAREHIQRLAERTGEYITLVIEEQGYGVLLFTEGGEATVDINTPPGIRTPLHSTAPGKCILAHLPEERVEEILDDHGLPARTENTVTDKEVLYEQLKEISEQGYAFEKEEHFEGMSGLACPILERQSVRGAISVYGPTGRIGDEKDRRRIREAASETANMIEVSLRYPPEHT